MSSGIGGVVRLDPSKVQALEGDRIPISLDSQGSLRVANASPQAYVLLTNATATGAAVGPVRGGDYVWTVEGTFNGATVALERQSRSGAWVAFVPAASLTAPGQVSVGIGQGATVRASVTGGTPSALFSDLSGLS